MTKISFELWGFHLLEPMALLFNWILTLQALYFYFKLRSEETSIFVKYWLGFFLFFAISTFFGGLSHLLFHYTGLLGKVPGWIAGIIAISSIEMSVASRINGETNKVLTKIIYFKAAVVLGLLVFDLNFTWIIIHTAVGMVFFLGSSSLIGILKGKSYLWFFFWAVLSLFLALPFRVFAIDIHLWFNRDDIGHVFMMITCYFLYLGVKDTMEHSLSLQYDK